VTGGVRVAVGNVDGSDRASLIPPPGPGGGPHVRSIKLLTSGGTVVATMELASFFAYHPTVTGGVFMAAGNVTDNGLAEIITGPDTGGGPHVQTFSTGGLPLGGRWLLRLPLHLHRRRPRGVRKPNPDAAGTDEIVTGAGPTGGPHILGFTGAGALSGTSFFAYRGPEPPGRPAPWRTNQGRDKADRAQ
jgi:hypothetical protein